MRHQLATWWQVLAAAQEISATRRLGMVMVDRGILSTREQNRLIRDQLRGIVVEALGWREGTFRFQPSVEPLQESVTLDWDVADAILTETRQSGEEALWRVVGGRGGRVGPPRSGLVPLRDLNSTERRIVAAADGSRSVAEIARRAAAPLPMALRTLAAIVRLGGCDVVPGEDPEANAGRPAEVVGARPAVPVEAGPERPADRRALAPEPGEQPGRVPWALPPDRRAERAAVLDLADRIERADLYQVLDVPANAPARAIDRAFHERCARFHPERGREPGMRDLRADLYRVQRALRAAHGILSDPKARAEYDRRRNLKWQESHARHAARDESCRAFLDRGTRLIREGRFPEAIAPLREAVRLRPDLGIARYRLGQCLATVPGGVEEARRHLREAARLEPRNPRYAEACRSLNPPRPAPENRRLGQRLSRWLQLPRDDQEPG